MWLALLSSHPTLKYVGLCGTETIKFQLAVFSWGKGGRENVVLIIWNAYLRFKHEQGNFLKILSRIEVLTLELLILASCWHSVFPPVLPFFYHNFIANLHFSSSCFCSLGAVLKTWLPFTLIATGLILIIILLWTL